MRCSTLRSLCISLAFAAPWVAGCDSFGTKPGTGEATGPKTYDRAKLPATTQELPPLDQGRVDVPTPKGWQWRSQEKGLLTRFNLQDRSGLPVILVKLDAEATSEIETVTPENVAAYAEEVHAALEAKGTKLLEPVRPLILGDSAWARYVIAGKLPDKQIATVERQILKTTRFGRTYVLELQVTRGELTQYRDAAYAIGAGMKIRE